MKKIFIPVLICFPFLILAQSSPNLLRSTISMFGSSLEMNNKYLIQQSVGQSSLVGLKYKNKFIVRQGFIQPNQLKRMSDNSIFSDFLVNVFPNPTKGNIRINFDKLVTSNILISVYDQTGKLVKSKSREPHLSLDLSLVDLSTGNYFLKINTSDKQYVTQISKQ